MCGFERITRRSIHFYINTLALTFACITIFSDRAMCKESKHSGKGKIDFACNV